MLSKAKKILLFLIFPALCLAQSNSLVLIIQLQEKTNASDIENKINASAQNFQVHQKEKLCEALNIYSFDVFYTTLSEEKIIKQLQVNRQVIAVQKRQKIVYRSNILNDTYFTSQWNLVNDGVLGGAKDADNDADLAWTYGTGNSTKNGDSIVIAVVDIGFDLNHEDLKFFTNKHEIANDLIDNDHNGYIDDVQGWNIENGNGNTNTGDLSTWHGTAVSGSAAASGNNQVGIAGIAYNAKILPIHLGDVLSDSVIKAYDYIIKMRQAYDNSAGDSGAYVVAINSSFGISDSPSNNAVWCNLYDFMGSMGIINTTATDNKSLNYDVVDDVPGNCASSFIINTTYSDKNDNLGNCGYGKINVDIAAPAGAIYLARPANQYSIGTGTSFAAPQIAGTIALLYSAACDSFLLVANNNPDSAALLIRKFILNGAESKPAFNNKLSSNGRLNVYNAVNEMRKFCGEEIISAPLSNEFKIHWSSEKDDFLYFNFDLISAGELNIYVYDMLGKEIAKYDSQSIDIGNFTKSISLQELSSGAYFLRISSNGKWSNSSRFVVAH